jgi:hypothetical protein
MTSYIERLDDTLLEFANLLFDLQDLESSAPSSESRQSISRIYREIEHSRLALLDAHASLEIPPDEAGLLLDRIAQAA